MSDSVDYADHIYDVARIETNDLPMFSDAFAPVENLLQPLSSILYNSTSARIVVNRKVDVYSIEGLSLLFVFPVLMF